MDFKNNISKDKMLDAILRNSGDLFFVKDSNFVYQMASDSFARLFGFNSGDEVIGLDDYELTGDVATTNVFRESDNKVFTTGEPVIDSLAEGKASEIKMVRMVSTSKYPIFDESGRVQGVLGICHDITPELRLKRSSEAYRTSYNTAVAANSAKTEFLSRMSHDIRTPLNTIMGLVALSQDNLTDTEKMKANLEKVQASGKHLLSIVNEVLDMEKIETNQIELNVGEFNLDAFTENFEAMMKAKAAAKRQTLTVKKQFTDTLVLGDPTRLEQIFVNLTNNAIKYTPEAGEILVTFSEMEPRDGVANYQFIVEDTGKGMTPEFMEHMFEPFTRQNDNENKNIEGIGLGLAIAKNLINMLGGAVAVESKQGKGTKFTVNIPLVVQNDSEAGEEATGIEQLKSEDFSDKRALLVEDNGLNAEIAMEILGITGIQFEYVENGFQAVEAFKKSPEGYFDVIFMDIQMPVMDGYEATRTIRAMDRADAATIPIMAMTANAFVSDINAAKAAGMNEHLAKPIDFDKLVDAMNKWL